VVVCCQRSTYSPDKFVSDSRPSWFVAGVQQDCSEFLRHLLNTIHEQELKSRGRENPPSLSMASAPNTTGGLAESRSAGPQLRSAAPESGSVAPKSGYAAQGFGSTSGSAAAESELGSPQSRSAIPGCGPFPLSPVPESRAQPSLVERSFSGSAVTTCRCLGCGAVSTRTESFMDLSLAIPESSDPVPSPQPSTSTHCTPAMVGGSPLVSEHPISPSPSSSGTSVGPLSVSGLLARFLTAERLDGDNQYLCESCHGLQDGERLVSDVLIRLVSFS